MRLLRAAVAAAVVAGCGYTETHVVTLRTPQGAGPRAELYMGDQPPPRPFIEAALLEAVGHGTHANPEHVTEALRIRAQILGCDAVVRVHVEQGYTMAHGFGVCVRYVAPVGPVPTPQSPPSGDVNL
jgi:hypothetical protein